jgi:hypothetical protein
MVKPRTEFSLERMRMKRVQLWFVWFLAALLLPGGVSVAADSRLPSIAGKQAVATVNGEPITVAEFRKSLDFLHRGVSEKETEHERNFSVLLQRLVNAKLLLQEARNIGLDALPEVKENLDGFRVQALRTTLLSRQVKGLRPHPREVEKAYRESIRELKVQSWMFGKEEDAQQAVEEIHSGAASDNVMGRMVTGGKARGTGVSSFVKGKDLLPAILEAALNIKEGEVTPPLKIAAGEKGEPAFTVLKLDGIRFTEDPVAKEEARKEVFRKQRLEAIRKYVDSLKKKYSKIQKKTVDALDYEAIDPGLDNLLKDQRVVAEIRGEKPIRVAELSIALQQKFYHGVERAAEGKKVNREKQDVLNEMVLTRVLRKEALRKKIDRTPEYKARFGEYRDELLFGMFVQKVIYPDIKVGDAAVRTYYEEHEKEYLSREEMRLDDLAFGKREDAADALEKLRKGADFKWVKANAPGQIAEKARQRIQPLGGQRYVLQELPEGVGEAVSGAGPEDFRMYASPEGQFFVLYVQETVPAKPYPFDQAKGMIREKLTRMELQRSIEEYAGKLRAASDIRIFATEEGMKKLFVPTGGKAAKP